MHIERIKFWYGEEEEEFVDDLTPSHIEYDEEETTIEGPPRLEIPPDLPPLEGEDSDPSRTESAVNGVHEGLSPSETDTAPSDFESAVSELGSEYSAGTAPSTPSAQISADESDEAEAPVPFEFDINSLPPFGQ